MKRNFNEPGPSRLLQTRRLLQVAAILASSRCGHMTIEDVAVKLREQTGDTWHDRTIRRDLYGLDVLGIVEQTDAGYRWTGRSESLTRVVLQSAESASDECPLESNALQGLLANLPDPWEMTADRHRVATSAARLAALADTGDCRCLKFQLVYALGKGWTLQDVGLEPSAFDKFKSIEQLAKTEFESVRWEPTEAVYA